jgi:hypothetical protein
MRPTAQEVIQALSEHPDIYAKVVREGAPLLVMAWHYDGPARGGARCSRGRRHLAIAGRSSESVAGEVVYQNGVWVSHVLEPTEHQTIREAMEHADREMRRIGYLLTDKYTLPRGPR